MLRELVIPAVAALSLAACSGNVSTTETASEPAATAGVEQASEPAMPAPATSEASASSHEDGAMVDPDTPVSSEAEASMPDAGEQGAGGDASIAGLIRVGNRPPPAMRVCAHPVDGGQPTCIESAEGARDYRIEVPAGRYFLMGWAKGGELKLVAHANQIRCIRPPCPPDTLIPISVGAGEKKTGITLSGGYVDVPAGWPKGPG